MSTNAGEPMFPANEAMHETSERLCAWDAMAVAGDREAMKAALQEYTVRLMFEKGLGGYFSDLTALCLDAEIGAIKEFKAAPIIKRGQVHA